MKISDNNQKNLCDNYNCEVTKTENGISIQLSSDDKKKVEQLHNMSDCCPPQCCSSDSKTESCC